MTHTTFTFAFPLVVALTMPFCAGTVRPTVWPWDARMASLWTRPDDLPSRDLFYGPWGSQHAPDGADTFTLLQRKHSGVNPGMTVRDSRGRKWSVKQASPDTPAPEGPIEVVVSRVLSAVGYHQPPVYYLPAFSLRDNWGVQTVAGGRFRLHEETLKDKGEWSWQRNPFVETRPFEGLLSILMLLNASDLKNDNNSLYVAKSAEGTEQLYVVRDLGTALGETGRLAPRRGDLERFERSRFILGIRDGFVAFDYHGWHQELVTGRIRPDDVAWACRLLGSLSERQWHDAFRAGGYPTAIADRYIKAISARITQGQALDDDTE